MSDTTDRWGIWVTSKPGCTPPAANWWGAHGVAHAMSEQLARAVAETCNRVNGTAWEYEAREMP